MARYQLEAENYCAELMKLVPVALVFILAQESDGHCIANELKFQLTFEISTFRHNDSHCETLSARTPKEHIPLSAWLSAREERVTHTDVD